MLKQLVIIGGALLVGGVALAETTSGTLYFTYNNGGTNVNSVDYNYDGTTFTLGPTNGIKALPGADGIIFAPDGSLLVGEQGQNAVGQVTTGGTVITTAAAGPNGSYHLALDPTGLEAYSNGFGASLTVMPFAANVIQNGTTYAIHGNDTGITSEAFAPGHGWFYVNGQPNGGGNVGTLNLTDLSNILTTQLDSGVQAAHGLVYDSYTGLLTMFGAGHAATLDPTTDALKQGGSLTCDFDQGGVDGQGHALVAGCNEITFIDYSTSHDITNPDFVKSIGGYDNIDDVAPLSGLGSATPEPTTFALIGLGLAAMGVMRRRSRS